MLAEVNRTAVAAAILLCGGALLIVLPLLAAESDIYVVRGNGGVSCGTWIQHRKVMGGDAFLDEQWVVGFISAISLALPSDRAVRRDLGEGTDTDGLFAWIDNHCTAHPLETLANATVALVNEMRPKWYAAHPVPK